MLMVGCDKLTMGCTSTHRMHQYPPDERVADALVVAALLHGQGGVGLRPKTAESTTAGHLTIGETGTVGIYVGSHSVHSRVTSQSHLDVHLRRQLPHLHANQGQIGGRADQGADATSRQTGNSLLPQGQVLRTWERSAWVSKTQQG